MTIDYLALAAYTAAGGAAGYAVSALRPTGRRRGAHRRLWQRGAARRDPHADTDVPAAGDALSGDTATSDDSTTPEAPQKKAGPLPVQAEETSQGE
ncbi:hypothetical protein DEJ49_33340 [Streptomyces venezuelae]|uniref:Uncharacterized protein n=1 Tax=Streptomyces venezuelae TaxID=54571 RepID=A0A5P2CQQ2_STRVZ|nr:hypothetical protein [Streptomyces venezuelae]QES45226.1 hypothetical protein DEJ49_33340 [Streptomyces venezuelae]